MSQETTSKITSSNIVPSNIKLLMVTRESGIDKRYGLGKTLIPIIEQMQHLGVHVIYLTQSDAGQSGMVFCRKIHSFFDSVILPVFRKKHLSGLLWGVIERINMGRLAVKVSKEHKITHVHCHDPIIAYGFWLFKKLYFLSAEIKCVITEHGFGSYTQAIHEDGCVLDTKTMSYLRKKEAQILLKADLVITPTTAALHQLARDLSVYPVPNHWLSIVHPLPKMKTVLYSAARKILNWQDDIFYILAVGRIVPLKQFPLLLQACAELENKNFQIVILGDGDSESLMQYAQNLGLQEQVQITTTDNIANYYAGADLYVSCSSTESFGYANLEALTMGLPVISTAVGGCTEVIADAGWLVPENKHAIKNAIDHIINNPSIRLDLSKRALQRASCWPTVEWVTASYLHTYQQPKKDLKNSLYALETKVDNHLLKDRLYSRIFESMSNQIKQLPVFPETQTLLLPKNTSIVVAVPHPDDETIWCGATLAKLASRSCKLSAILFSDGEAGDPDNYFPNQLIGQQRFNEFKKASSLLGIKEILRLQQEDGNYQPLSELKMKINQWLQTQQPEWIFIPHLLDAHRDHIQVSLTMLELWLKLEQRPRLFFYDGWWPTQVNCYVDISEQVNIKEQALNLYKTPLKYIDYVKLSHYLNHYRGITLGNKSHVESFFEITQTNYEQVLKSLFDLHAITISSH